MNAVILAAGKGTRLKEITKTIPKPLLEVQGRPILAHQLELCARARIDNVFINTHYLSDQIREFAGDGKKFGVKIVYSYEPELLGTAGALNNFRSQLGREDFFVFYGDNYVDPDLNAFHEFHKVRGTIATIGLHRRDDVSDSGMVVLGSSNRIERFVEKPNKNEQISNFVNAGVYLLHPQILNFIPAGYSDFGYDIFPKLLAERRPIFGYDLRTELIAIDTPELYATARAKT